MHCLMNLNPLVTHLTFCPSSLHPFSLSILFTASSHHLFYKELRGRFCWLRSELTSLILSWTPAQMSNQRARKERMRRRRRRARAKHLRQQTRKVSEGQYHWYHGEQTLQLLLHLSVYGTSDENNINSI